MVIFVAPVSHCVELALFAVDFSGKFPKYVAAVPHLHSIHPSITRESKWRYIMKKINLRELYPDVYTTDFFVDVTEEVERFWDNTRWMIEFSVLRPSTAYGSPGEEMRLFLTEDGYQAALQSQQRREIKIQDWVYG